MDYKSDLILLRKIAKKFKNKKFFGLKDILSFYKKNPEFFEKNRKSIEKLEMRSNRNPFYVWQKANQFIAGGNSLFSNHIALYGQKK